MKPILATVNWKRSNGAFVDGRYSRSHHWSFDGGATVLASSSPHIVPPPLSDPTGVDPEEAFVASLSSCHMLWFLSIAAKRGFVVDAYSDQAQGHMGKNGDGKIAMVRVTLRPKVSFATENLPTQKQIESMHDDAHEQCFIANSVNSSVECEPVF